MHDHGIRLEQFDIFLIDSEEPAVFIDAGEEPRRLPFMLDTQQIHHICAVQSLFQPVTHFYAGFFKFPGNQSRRTGEYHFRPQFQQAPHITAGHTAVENIADNGNFQTFDPAFFLPDGEDVQQCLGGMAVGPVTGIDHTAGNVLGNKVLGPGGTVTHHQQIHLQCFNIPHGIQQGLPLGQTAGGGGHVHNVRTQPLFGKFKGNPGTGGGFHKEVHHRLAPESRDFFHVPFRDFFELFGRIENMGDLFCRKVIQTQQVFPCPAKFRRHLIYLH